MFWFKRILVILIAILIWGAITSNSFGLIKKVIDVATPSETIDNSSSFIEDDNQILRNINVADIVEFGRYYDLFDDDVIRKVPIKWIVLDIADGYALLISRDILKTMPYNFLWTPINWKDSDIRFWLNYDFYDISFNDKEKELIKNVTLENIGNHAYNIKYNIETNDNVFLLSIEEARKYYKHREDYMSIGTSLAKKEGLWISKYISSTGYSVWWLRSPGKNNLSAAIIHAAGTIGIGGDGVATRENGVRPCIWVKIDNKDE